MAAARKKRLFISYRSTDRAAVDELVRDLTSTGEFEVWIDRQALKVGQAWWDAILDAIGWADVVIAPLSRGALASEACSKERAYALALGKPLLPLIIDPRIDASRLPPELSARQALRYASKKAEFDALVDAVRAVGFFAGMPTPAPPRPSAPTARRVPAVGLLGALLIGGLLMAGGLLVLRPQGSATPTASAAPVVVAAQPTVDPTAPLAGAVIYEGRDAFTVLFSQGSAVGITLTGLDWAVDLLADFPDAAAAGDGACLRYVRSTAEAPPLPMACSSARTLTRPVGDSDVFWWIDAQVAARPVTVRRAGEMIQFCTPTDSRCDFSVEPS